MVCGTLTPVDQLLITETSKNGAITLSHHSHVNFSRYVGRMSVYLIERLLLRVV